MEQPQALIDCHHHLWALDGSVHYPWLEDEILEDFFLGDYSAFRRPFLATDLKALVPAGYRLAGSVHCEAEAARAAPEVESDWLTAHSAAHGLPTALVGWAAFGTPDCEAQLERQMRSALFRGVRAKPRTVRHAQQCADLHGQPGTLQDPTWTRGLHLLAERELSWDLRVPAWHLEDAAEALEAVPGLDVILNHTGLPWDRSAAGLALWRRGMCRLAENPRVVVKLSELGSPMAAWDRAQNIEVLSEAIGIFDPSRCLFASNFPVTGLNASYGEWLCMVEEAIADAAPQARQAILHDNAARCYRLPVDGIGA
ncbi:amidohydrolase family protein [Halomonas sp. V046]|uniref:amidohydrolase family protein n=1 Tax=Halomonas sp. V046 TaxID=3459611 RepID=UPI004044018A